MKQSLMVDLDDVIVNNTWKDQIEAFLGHELDLSKIEYILEEALESRKQEFYDSLEEYNMYKGATLKENAFETLEKLNEKYNLFIVSAFESGQLKDKVGEHLKNKYEFIINHLPFIHQHQIIFINDKTALSFWGGIDDKLNNLGGCKKKLLYKAWHNENYSEEELKKNNIIMVSNWQEIKKILLEE